MRDDYTLQALAPDQWAAYRELRLRALREDPDAFGSTYAEAAALPLEQWRARLTAAAASGSALPLVANADGALIGLVWIVRDAAEPSLCNVYQMWVAPEHRGRGVAQALLTRGIEWARAGGASSMELSVTVADSPAMRLYARLGFERVGDPEPLREGSALLAQRMRLALGVSTLRGAIKRPLTASSVPAEVWYAGTDREIRGRALCDVGGRARIGVGLLELPPGSHTRPAHWHSLEEEHLYALSGAAILQLGDERHELLPGSYVCFPAGQPVPHHLENHGDEPFVYLMIGERIDGDRVFQS